MRDNAKENSSKAICDYFTSMGVKNYYSAGYEPWQDGLAEASTRLTIMLFSHVMLVILAHLHICHDLYTDLHLCLHSAL